MPGTIGYSLGFVGFGRAQGHPPGYRFGVVTIRYLAEDLQQHIKKAVDDGMVAREQALNARLAEARQALRNLVSGGGE